MNVVLMMVSTVNGKITVGDNPDVSGWTSEEDKALFSRAKKAFPVILMGIGTFEMNASRIQPTPGTVRIVLTKNPEKYRSFAVPGQLEFSDESPESLLDRLEKNRTGKVLLLGGSQINASFFRDKLVNELHLTVEPLLFGTGKNLIADIPHTVRLRLKRMEKINANGTLHLEYSVHYDD